MLVTEVLSYLLQICILLSILFTSFSFYYSFYYFVTIIFYYLLEIVCAKY